MGHKTHVLLYFVMFECVWDRFVTELNSVQNGLNWCNLCKSLCHEVASDVFTMNTSNPPHWTLNSSFVEFLSVWVHLGLFCYGSKLSAKWAELVQLMQKFVPQSCVRSFRNERTWSTPLHPKLIFCCVFIVFGCIWDHFVTAWNSVQNGLNWCN